jgi:hypothetical protein
MPPVGAPPAFCGTVAFLMDIRKIRSKKSRRCFVVRAFGADFMRFLIQRNCSHSVPRWCDVMTV